jgi:hypothetical protein
MRKSDRNFPKTRPGSRLSSFFFAKSIARGGRAFLFDLDVLFAGRDKSKRHIRPSSLFIS